jgi:hypothetical protein
LGSYPTQNAWGVLISVMPCSWGFTLHEIPPKIGGNQANREGCIMKNEMLSLLLDEKICLCKVTYCKISGRSL